MRVRAWGGAIDKEGGMARRTRRLRTILLAGLVVPPLGAFALEPLPDKAPVPADNPMSDAKIALGKQLYFDKRLSADDSISCQTCHDVMKSGGDDLPTSKGIRGQLGGRNAPTVWNSAFWTVQFWDGRAPTLEEQAKGPLTNPVEMGMKDHPAAVAKVKAIPGYVPLFKAVFGGEDPVTIDNLAKAIAAYERTLITPNSAYDKWKRGDQAAMTEAQKKGFAEFQNAGCVACHGGAHFSGPEVPGGFYMKFPTFTDNDYARKYDLTADKGRMEVTKNPDDANRWRVPSLRNAAITAPYFHNGKVATLDEAVRVMAKTQLNRNLSDEQVRSIVAFLGALTGERPAQTEPKLP